VVALALVGLGCAVVAFTSIGAAVARGDVFMRLHFVTPVTSLGAPLVGAGVCVDSGQPWVVCEVALIVVLLFLSGPVLEMATGRAAAQRRGIESEAQPE
jgi:multicomponent Na+:H+ antiporter subunit G